MEHSRPVLESHGIHLAAISYDAPETLLGFAQKYRIRFPLLSDRESAVIRAFGILNTNIAPGLRAHGVPHPVEYLVAPDGLVVRKYFVPNYQHRVTGSAVALREFGAVVEGAPEVTVKSDSVAVKIWLASGTAFAGQEISFAAEFMLDPGWHVYGTPLPEAYIPTSVVFEDPKVIAQSFHFPATAQKIHVLGETLTVYSDSFRGVGSLLLKFPLEAGAIVLSGQIRFQRCNETTCEPPETIPFQLPLTLEPFVVATSAG